MDSLWDATRGSTPRRSAAHQGEKVSIVDEDGCDDGTLVKVQTSAKVDGVAIGKL